MRHAQLLMCLAAALVIVSSLSGCDFASLATATRVDTRSTAHIDSADLVVQGVNGTVDVIADAGRSDVQVVAEITAGGMTQERAEERLAETVLSVTRDTNRVLTVTTEFPQPTSFGDVANLTIRIPAAANVRITSVNGTITVTGLEADLQLQTTNGRIVANGNHGDASANTVNGRIEFENHAGSVTATSTNGRISMIEHNGPASATTVNGRVTVSLTPDQAGPLTLLTTNGRIEATVGPAFAGEVSLSSGNGSINVTDPAGLIASKDTNRRSATLRFGEGGQKSTLRTSNGRINFTVSE